MATRALAALVCAIVIGPQAQPALAQPQASAAATGRSTASVVQPLRAIMRRELSFGTLTVSPLADGSVRLPAAPGPAAYTGSAAPLCLQQADCQPHRAEVDVRGQAGRTYRVQLPAAAQAVGRRTGQVLAVSELAMHSRNRPGAGDTGLLDAAGSDSLLVGGLLTVPAGTRADNFRADLTIAVAYE